MEVIVKTSELAETLRLVQFLAERKTTIPILGTLLLRADQKGLAICGTDLEQGGICYCPATIKKAGSIAVPFRHNGWPNTCGVCPMGMCC